MELVLDYIGGEYYHALLQGILVYYSRQSQAYKTMATRADNHPLWNCNMLGMEQGNVAYMK